jgi:prevent-host-death family protein
MNTVLEIGSFEAKTHLSGLLEKVAQGKTFRITRRGRPVAELRPIQAAAARPRFGDDKDRIVIRDDFDDPLPEMKDFQE